MNDAQPSQRHKLLAHCMDIHKQYRVAKEFLDALDKDHEEGLNREEANIDRILDYAHCPTLLCLHAA